MPCRGHRARSPQAGPGESPCSGENEDTDTWKLPTLGQPAVSQRGAGSPTQEPRPSPTRGHRAHLQASPGAPRSPSRSPGDSAGKKGPLVRSVSALQGSTPREREPTLAWPLKQRRSPHSTAVLEPEGLQNCLFLAAV